MTKEAEWEQKRDQLNLLLAGLPLLEYSQTLDLDELLLLLKALVNDEELVDALREFQRVLDNYPATTEAGRAVAWKDTVERDIKYRY